MEWWLAQERAYYSTHAASKMLNVFIDTTFLLLPLPLPH
jgi:hypothetical protein